MRNVAPLQDMLVSGGDERIACNAQGRNKYGCFSTPQQDVLAFGSSTASTVSKAGFAASERLYRVLADARTQGDRDGIRAWQEECIKRELAALCGLGSMQGLEIVLGASGTDIFRFIARLLRETYGSLHIIMTQESETGSGVKAALGDGTIAVRCRLPNGNLRLEPKVDAEVELQATQAIAAGKHVLLIVTDVSKTGLITSGAPGAMTLKRRFPEKLDILVDGCQFRFSNATLRHYLQNGCMVALTGSKFVTGPAFCGALLLPQTIARLALPPAASDGLLLRWQAALTELGAFAALPEEKISEFLQGFARTVQQYLADSALFAPVALRDMQRPSPGWDSIPTIFPFLLRHRGTGTAFSPEETQSLYQCLVAQRVLLGQPVAYRKNTSALRLNMDMRLIVDAIVGRGADAVTNDALAALDKTALLAQRSA